MCGLCGCGSKNNVSPPENAVLESATPAPVTGATGEQAAFKFKKEQKLFGGIGHTLQEI